MNNEELKPFEIAALTKVGDLVPRKYVVDIPQDDPDQFVSELPPGAILQFQVAQLVLEITEETQNRYRDMSVRDFLNGALQREIEIP